MVHGVQRDTLGFRNGKDTFAREVQQRPRTKHTRIKRLSRFSGLVARPSPGPSHALLLFQSGRGAVRNGSLQIAFRKVLLRKAEKPHDHVVTRRGLRACCAVLCCVASVVFEAPENEAMCWLQTMEPCGADWTPSHAALSPKACFLPRPPSGRGRRIRQSH